MFLVVSVGKASSEELPRLTPTISFQLDSLPTTARSIEDALAQAQARDAAIASGHVTAEQFDAWVQPARMV